jgi:hypothetical protein
VRAHVYMARNLRAANENGLSSTYVEVSIGGKALSLLTPQRRNTYDAEDEDIEDVSATVSEGQDVMDAANCMWQSSKHKQTAVAEDTLNPVWMQTLYSQEKLIVDDSAEPNSIQALTYAPDIVLTVYNRDNVGKEDFVGRCNFPTVLALSNGKTQEMQYWPGENTMNVNPYDENNTKRPIWLQLRAGDLTLSRTSVKEDKGKADSSIYGTNNDCEGEILVWFEVIPEEAWEALQEMELDEKDGKLKRWWQRAAVAAVLFVGFVLLLISFIFLFPTTPPCFLSIFFLFQKVVVPWMLVIIGLVQPHVKFIWCHWE